ncbi:MAG: Ig-like domain-containing protein, partial [Halobacteriales archaeon]|nr:Ig-like domain-containing protein [Halobacteriales archaeon]
MRTGTLSIPSTVAVAALFAVSCDTPTGTSPADAPRFHHSPGHGGGGSNEFSVSMEFRNAAGDRITSQGNATYQDDVDGNLRIRDDGHLLWNVNEGRGFVVDFTDVIHGGGGLPAQQTVTRVGALRALASEDASDELVDGLLGMADGETLPAKLKTRAEFDAEGTYQLRFQRGAEGTEPIADSIASGSSFLTIIRNGSSGPCSTVAEECWTIEARVTGAGPGTQDDWAMVFHKTGRGSNTTFTDEGSFHMPFLVTVICPDCPPASGNADNPPTVSITQPANGSTVSGTISVVANASDDGTVTQVEFFVDGTSLGIDSDGSDGWSIPWNTSGVADGGHTVSATATDDAGQTGSDAVGVTVDNVDDPPAVSITNP